MSVLIAFVDSGTTVLACYHILIYNHSHMYERRIEMRAKFFKSLSDPSRLLILESLSDGPLSVSQVVEATGLTQPNASSHLACLSECGLVNREKKGREVFYNVTAKEISTLLKNAEIIIKKNAQELYRCANY